jgi:hypothetical protein
MHALIDADIFCYEMGSAKDDEGKPLAWPLVVARIDTRLEGILATTGAESWQGYLTGKGNFRDATATIKPYKGNRDRSERPYWFRAVYTYLVTNRYVQVVQGYEADDQIAMDQGEGTIICSRDKDLKQVPGWHYSWPSGNEKEREPFYVSELQGLQFFYSQMLTGDTADNIPGLYGVGPKAACVERLKECQTELEMFQEVQRQYELRFGSYWEQFMTENGRLLWMLRSPDDDWQKRQAVIHETLQAVQHHLTTS